MNRRPKPNPARTPPSAETPGLFITALKPVRGQPALRRIFIGRKAVGDIASDRAEELGFRLGAPWTEDLQAQLARLTAERKATTDAARLITRRPRSRAELLAELVRRGHEPHAADAAVRVMAHLGAVNDAALAATVATGRLSRGRATGDVERALARRGVHQADAQQAISHAAADDGRTDLERAMAVARARLRGSLGAEPVLTRQRRLFALLQRRGYDDETCRAVIAALVPDETPGGSD
jgi:regulatory protein